MAFPEEGSLGGGGVVEVGTGLYNDGQCYKLCCYAA